MQVQSKTSEEAETPTAVGRWGVSAPIEATYTETGLPGVAAIRMTIDVVEGRLEPVRVDVQAAEGQAITGTILRSVPVHELARYALSGVLMRRIDGRDDAWAHVDGLSIDPDAVRAAGPTDESLRVVADIYEIARLMGLPPARQVEKDLGLPRTTASKWVRKAREKGILEADPVRPDVSSSSRTSTE